MGALQRVRASIVARDPGREALHRGIRGAIVMPGSFALALKVIDNPTMAPFSAFGAVAMLLLFSPSGSRRERVQLQAALVLVGAALVCLGTLASRSDAVAVAAMAVVGFLVIFAGVVSSVLAGAANALLLSFILPVSLPGPSSTIPDRAAGWLLSGALSVLAVGVLWPDSGSLPLLRPAREVCRTLAACLRRPGAVDEPASDAASAALDTLGETFLRTPYRPTGLSTEARAAIRLVDELRWLGEAVRQAEHRSGPRAPVVAAVGVAAATVLERCAELLAAPGRSLDGLGRARTALRAVTHGMIRAAARPRADDVAELVTALDPAFRAQEASFMTEQVAANVEVFALASRRRWWERALGRQPAGFAGRLASVRERARAHLALESTSLHNSLRGGAGLGLAVLIARLLAVEHAFWVSLATLTVLRSSALSTGQTVVRALAGTTAGFVVGAGIVLGIGTNQTVLWLLLPVAVLFAGVIPVAVSFLAGQASFTVVLFILFNILAPAGWRIGLVRIEDIALGGAVSLAVGLLFWPRGAASALGRALAVAYAAAASYLARTVDVAVACCAPGMPGAPSADRAPAAPGAPGADRGGALSAPHARAAAAASRRLDDTFRAYLAERGSKRLALSEVTTLVTGTAALRLAGDGILALWQEDPDPTRSRVGAARELRLRAQASERWYAGLGDALRGLGAVPAPETRADDDDARLLATIAPEFGEDAGERREAVTRIVWTGDYLDTARRLEPLLARTAREVERRGALGTLEPSRRRRAATRGAETVAAPAASEAPAG